PGNRLRRHGARRFPARATDRSCRGQRGEHDSRLHHDQHVLEAVGRVRHRLSGAARPAGRAGHRTPRRKAAAPHQPDMTEFPREGLRVHQAGPPALALALIAWLTVGDMRAVALGDLQGLDGLARAYRSILEARFDRVDADLRRACGPAPPEACDVLAATALWWQILLDPESRTLDDH